MSTKKYTTLKSLVSHSPSPLCNKDQTIVKDALKTAIPNFGTFPDFVTKFKAAFIHADVENEARHWLVTAHVSKELSLKDYITDFQNHIALCRATE